MLELPDLPQNRPLLDFLRGQATPPSGPADYTLGRWQLHTHPDLIDRLLALGAGCPLSAAYGVPLLARGGIAAVVALGTGSLVVRSDHLPAAIESRPAAPDWTFVGGDWHIVDPWQSQLPAEDGTRALRNLVSGALQHAGGLDVRTVP